MSEQLPSPEPVIALNFRDTIVALATPPGRSGLGVVRLSGSDARRIAEQILNFSPGHQWRPWTCSHGWLRDDDGERVDEVLVTWFAAPRSYTAEDITEISCHGSPVVLGYCVDAALRAGARFAEPGEFTLRAFANGRIDLPRAEAVRDLIESSTIFQAKVAAQQLDGSLSRQLAPLKDRLLSLISTLEAGIDFAEDATSEIDIPETDEILPVIDGVLGDVRRMAESYQFGRYVHDGFQLAIVGRPNVGKSSLFNALLEQERAIVTEIPGTTRDLVSERAAIGGIPVRLMDTAGIRVSGDRIEKLGIERSYRAVADADLVILVLDRSAPLEEDDRALLKRVSESGLHLVVANKCDLPRAEGMPVDHLSVSATLRTGLEDLRNAILGKLSPGDCIPSGGALITNARHAGLLRECAASLEQARRAQMEGLPHEMLLLDLYGALQPMDAITGATPVEEILHRIFSTFCIGK